MYTSGVVGIQSLLTIVILTAAWVVAFFSRLFAVVRFESIIHEFDPWLVFTNVLASIFLFNLTIKLSQYRFIGSSEFQAIHSI